MHLTRHIFVVLLLLTGSSSFAQLNTTLLANLDYEERTSDIWGYVAPDGSEYALIGVESGVSIVSLADPQNPVEVVKVAGSQSIWRDIKTYGEVAYVIADQPSSKDGVQIIDLQGLPGSVYSTFWYPAPNGQDSLLRGHNLYIDERGLLYVAGSNLNSGGMLFFDVANDPLSPEFLGQGAPIYAHDVFAQNNLMYASELGRGQLAIYDVTDPADVQVLATQPTPFRFTHNAWATAGNEYVFTTDERANAPVAAYDIRNLNNIVQLDQYRPDATLGQDVIPHNVHVRDNWLVISYYTDGIKVVDAQRPSNLVEVAAYDTYPVDQSGFHGVWGVYPYLPSGILIASDIESGLFVFDVDYVRASYLEGRVTDAQSDAPIDEVTVAIDAPQFNIAATGSFGNYKTGLGLEGTYEVTFFHPEYLPKTVEVAFQQGEVVVLDVALTPKPRYSITGKITSEEDHTPISGARVIIANEDFVYQATTDQAGNFQIREVIEGTYNVFAGAWGYLHRQSADNRINDDSSVSFTLPAGYQDDFLFDFGWTTEGDAKLGGWERGVPDAVFANSSFITPPFDIDGDFGSQAYLTGNGGGAAGADDVDDGTTRLISPPFDLTGYQTPQLSYYTWFFNDFGSSTPDDTLRISLTNGQDTVLLEEITESRSAWREQSVFALDSILPLTASMQLLVETGDRQESGNVVEAAFDAFRIQDAALTAVKPIVLEIQLQAFPNPFVNQLTLHYRFPEMLNREGVLRLYNLLGQEVQRYRVDQREGTLQIGQSLRPGTYFIVPETGGAQGKAVKIVKVK